jgi:hypothetical protein
MFGKEVNASAVERRCMCDKIARGFILFNSGGIELIDMPVMLFTTVVSCNNKLKKKISWADFIVPFKRQVLVEKMPKKRERRSHVIPLH